MDEYLDAVIEEITKDHPTPAQSAKIESLYKQLVEPQKHAEY